MLLFKKQFLEAIRSGAKTQTIRLAKVMRFRTGQRSYIPGAGYIHIDSVEPVSLCELTETDALRDGFANLAELRAALAAIYPSEAESAARPWRIQFHLLPAEEQVMLMARWKRAAPKTPGG